MKKVLIVCRFNQARSILIGALLRKLFPELEVHTAGIEAPDGSPIPAVTSEICYRWQILDFDRLSKSIESFNYNEDWDAVLAADQLVFERLQNSPFALKVSNLLDFADFQESMPRDPTNLVLEDFATELAKAALLSARWAEKVLGYENSRISGILYSSPEGLLNYLEEFKGLRDNVLLIDTEIQYPNFDLWKSLELPIELFNPRRLESINEKTYTFSGIGTLVSQYEIDVPEMIYVSKSWRSFLLSQAKNKHVILVNFNNDSLNKLGSKSYLSLLNSSKTEFIG